jgi:hypothetical protein
MFDPRPGNETITVQFCKQGENNREKNATGGRGDADVLE